MEDICSKKTDISIFLFWSTGTEELINILCAHLNTMFKYMGPRFQDTQCVYLTLPSGSYVCLIMSVVIIQCQCKYNWSKALRQTLEEQLPVNT